MPSFVAPLPMQRKPAPITAASLLATLPPETLPRRRPVRAEDNGWPLAVRAAKAAKSTPDLSALIYRDLAKSTNIALARRALAARAPRFALLKTALEKPVWLQPVASELTLTFPSYSGLKDLAKALTLRADLALADGRPNDAIADLLAVRRMATLTADSDGMIIGYLVGVAVRAIGDRALQRAVWHPNMTSAALRTALANVPEAAPTDPVLARTEISEIRDGFIPNLVTMRRIAVDPKATDPGSKVFRGHPNPFDPADTLRLAAGAMNIAVANTERAWKDQVEIPAMNNDWGDVFSDDDDKKQPTPAQFAAYRKAIAGVKNPMGRVIAAQTAEMYEGVAQASFRSRAEDSATRATLLLALAARENGGLLPKSLPEPVRDPFSGESLKYDPARALLWSVGPDGRDDRADGLPGALSTGRDLVWSARGRNSATNRAKTSPPPLP